MNGGRWFNLGQHLLLWIKRETPTKSSESGYQDLYLRSLKRKEELRRNDNLGQGTPHGGGIRRSG